MERIKSDIYMLCCKRHYMLWFCNIKGVEMITPNIYKLCCIRLYLLHISYGEKVEKIVYMLCCVKVRLNNLNLLSYNSCSFIIIGSCLAINLGNRVMIMKLLNQDIFSINRGRNILLSPVLILSFFIDSSNNSGF